MCYNVMLEHDKGFFFLFILLCCIYGARKIHIKVGFYLIKCYCKEETKKGNVKY